VVSRVADWLNERWPVRALMRWSLEEEIPGGASYAYTFGSSALFLFIVQAVTGIWQLLYYVPTVDHAYDSVSYLRTQVPLGWLVHGLHYWGSNAFIVLVAIHVARVFIWGAYKRPRELTWVIGSVLLLLVAAMTFTGALLPWDQLGYWAAQVGTSIAGTVPIVGDFIERLMRGGATMAQLALSRFFAVHVGIFAGVLALFIGVHLIAFRQFGSVGPWHPEGARRKGWFWPDQAFKDLLVVSVLLLILIGLCVYWPAPITGPADPQDTTYTPKPEWNFLFLYQALKAFSGRWEAVGTVGVPVVLGLILFLLPFYDRGEQRNPKRRIVAMAVAFILAAGLGALTIAGYYSNPAEATGAAVPPRAGASAVAKPRRPSRFTPAARAGMRLFYVNGCIGCHTINGKGGSVGPELSNESGRGRSRGWLTIQIRDPRSHYANSPMPAFTRLSDREVGELVAFLESLREVGPGAAPAAQGAESHGTPLPASGKQGPPGPAADMIGNAAQGAKVFQRMCQACHGPEGVDKVPNPGSDDGTVAPIKDIDPELRDKDALIFAQNLDRFIQHGSRPDGPHPAMEMPAFGATNTLTQQQISNVEAYVLRLNRVDRAQIVHPGIPPRTFFVISVIAFGVTWLALGAWWGAARRKREGATSFSAPAS